MKFVSYRFEGRDAYGLVVGDGVVDLSRRLDGPKATLKGLIASGEIDQAQAFLAETPDHKLADIEFRPVIPNPDKILAIGLNYATHIKETGRDTPKQPMIFMRYPNACVGHLQPMIRPKASERLDFEGELALIVGAGGRHIPKAWAYEHVAGYACFNDGSVRDWQNHTSQFGPGKNFMGTGPFGPWMVTPDEAGDPNDMELITRLNGQVMQQAPVSDLMFDIPTLIEYCSTFTHLEPGDVISTGTTGGVGARRTPPLWMKPGDTIEVEITHVGILRNPIVDEA
ncbi:MAG TPA: fumarylacetoacetate hydrolase family protein [Alphaproteobacteria bacterium]|nr:fumarylacetoacetate hydrolase family protein [Alphaproteobacteria bacterium]